MQIGTFVAPKLGLPKTALPFGHSLRGAALFAALAMPLTGMAALAQQTPVPAAQAPSNPAPATPAPAAPAPSTPANPPVVAPAPAGQGEGDIKTTDMAARPVLTQHGSANWEDGYKVIGDSLGKLRAAAEKNNMKVSGRPIAVFVETDDGGFKYDAMLPVDAPADAKFDLGSDIALGMSPAGKAIKFQHRGAYDDIDSTYEAITAYLDEKGLEARNLFVEEYLNDGKDSSDVSLQVDIYVFLK